VTLPEYQSLSQRPRHSLSTNLPVVEESLADGEVAALYAHFREHFGRQDVPGILKCFATHPPLLRHMMDISDRLIFSDGHLGRRHKEMIATLVSTQNRCAYCADSHGYFLRVHGGSDEVLCALQRIDLDSPSLTERERALLRFVLKVNGDSAQISSTDIEQLAIHGWSELQASEAIHVTALFATFNRVVNAFGLPSQGLLAWYNDQAGVNDQDTIKARSIR